MDHRAQEKKQRNKRCSSLPSYSDEERRAGIVRLLTEACCARLRKQGRLKTPETPGPKTLPLNTGYDFLQ